MAEERPRGEGTLWVEKLMGASGVVIVMVQAHFGVDLRKSNMPISFVFVPGRSLLEAWR